MWLVMLEDMDFSGYGSGLVGYDGIQVLGIWICRGVFRARGVASRYYYQNGKGLC